MLRAVLSVFLLRIVEMRLQSFPDLDIDVIVVGLKPIAQATGKGSK